MSRRSPADEAASQFRALVTLHASRLRRHIRVVYPDADIDSVVNEVFATAWRRQHLSQPSTAAWLRSVARNVILNTRRSEHRWQALNDRVNSLERRLIDHTSQHDPDPAHTHLLAAALAQLADNDIELLMMTSTDDLTTDELADILQVRAGTVKVRLSRARARLRAAYHEVQSQQMIEQR